MFHEEHNNKKLMNNNNYRKGVPFIKCQDYTVSKEYFNLYYNEDYDMLFTKEIPNNIGSYYESKNYISHTDGNNTIIDNIYNIVKNYTLKKKLKLINSFKTEEKKILDIGAGTGDFLKKCKEDLWKVDGVEPSEKARKIARQKNIELKETVTKLENNKYDVISMWHVLEHVIDLEEYIIKLKKLLKKNGVIIIAVPNFKSHDAIHYKEHWAAYDVPRHIWHFSKKSIEKIFYDKSMQVYKVLPMKFDSYYVSLLSEKYKENKNKAFNAFFRGLLSNYKALRTKEYSSLIYLIKNT